MPVHIEWVDVPTDQDWIDLQKLYSEAPAHWFEDHDPTDAHQSVHAYVTQHTQSEHWMLAAGRFNDRLIAAASIKPIEGRENEFVVEDLVVRQVTRNRGVAHQLLIRLCHWADGHDSRLTVQSSDDTQQAGEKLALYGFHSTESGWSREPNTEIVAQVQQ